MLFGTPHPIGEVKAAGDGWEVSGYLSTYGNVDLGGDVVMRGAFDDALAAWRAGQHKIRFLRQHNSEMVLGVPLELKSDDAGLFGRFRISKTTLGAETRELLKDGALDSFSIGYVPTDYAFDDAGVRKLQAIDLLEGSVVAIPMNPEAVVTGVKALDALPFAEKWQTVGTYLRYGVDEAKALQARRHADQRELGTQHLEALRAALPEARAYVAELEELLAEADVKARPGGRDYRLEIARRRLRLAGILEPAHP